MKNYFTLILLLIPFVLLESQGNKNVPGDTLTCKRQLSSWTHLNPSNDLPVWIGARYIPQINYNLERPKNRLIDFEISVNAYGNIGLQFSDTSSANGSIKPYRIWARYSTRQFEFRVGLQKINFGSAVMLRPLMWFDQIDPRDPLQLADGVWGMLGRYYLLNNANFWIWCLYGNKNPKGWETITTNKKYPEIGGRFQSPLPHGEAALTYHYRIADSRDQNELIPQYSEIPENRIGIDARFDIQLGFWLEASWISKSKNIGAFTNQEIMNLGIDYTFGIGNGLYLIYEQLIASFDETPFEFSNTITFSLISLSYPIGIFDNLSAIVYFDWDNKSAYNFINWQKQFDKITLYIMGYWNPENYQIPTLDKGENLYAGKGLQLMLVYNH